MPNYKQLCTDLLAALKSWFPDGGSPLEGPELERETALIARAEAATEWGKRFERWHCEYTLDATPEIVKVCPNNDPEDIQTFRVRAQTSRDYYATELTTP